MIFTRMLSVTKSLRFHVFDMLYKEYNSIGLIAKLELNPEFMPVAGRMNLVENLDHEPLSTSLSSLFQGLDIAI